MKTTPWLTVLILSGALNATAQVLKPIDPTKQADEINNKTFHTSDVDLKTISQPTRDLSRSPLTNKQQKFNEINSKTVNLQSLEHPTIPMNTLPQKNFTAKRAAESDKTRAESKNILKQPAAPITDRQLHPFAPGGEEELKKQLNPER